jgi:hypothetical protein
MKAFYDESFVIPHPVQASDSHPTSRLAEELDCFNEHFEGFSVTRFDNTTIVV